VRDELPPPWVAFAVIFGLGLLSWLLVAVVVYGLMKVFGG